MKYRYEIAKQLREAIEDHDRRYYVEDNPIISDKEYDELVRELRELEEAYPEVRLPDSYPERVGGEPLEKFEKVTHNPPMLSMNNSYNEEEALAFLEKTRDALGVKLHNMSFLTELKLDGVGVSLVYEEGELVYGATRGDGRIGENVTSNIVTIMSVPLAISYKGHIEVRGEVVMRRSIFEKLNKQRSENGEPLFANPRNAAAGTLRQLDPKIVASRGLDFFAYQIINCEHTKVLQRQPDALDWLKERGFQVEPHWSYSAWDEAVTATYNMWIEKRDELDYEADGLVIKVGNFEQQEALGTTSSRPKWAMAFKFPARQATTQIRDVTFQVGRTGAITPVAELEPVKLAGATISRATLHNFDEIERLGIRVGDTIFLERAGDVIPKVVKVVEERRTGSEIPIERPSECPVCGSPVYQPDGEVVICCINGSCPAKVIDNLRHFVSRSGRDIEGVGKETLAKLVEAGLVKDPADLYFLTEEDLEGLQGVKGKTINNILSAIEASRDKGLESIVSTLGIPKVGRHLAPILVEHFPTMDELINATVEELVSIDGIGQIVAHNIVECLHLPSYNDLIEKFRKAGIKLTADQPEQSTEPLALTGKTFVLTGKLSVPRGEMESQIKAAGGKVSNNVSKNTSYVIVGEKPGSKLTKAVKLDVPTLTEDDFHTLYL